MLLCSGDTAARCRLLDISLESEAIFEERYVVSTDEFYTGTTTIPFTKVTLMHYQKISKKATTWIIDLNNLYAGLL